MALKKVGSTKYDEYGKVQAAKGYKKNSDGIIVNVAGKEGTKYVICPKTTKTEKTEEECKQYALRNLSMGAKVANVNTTIGNGELFEF